MAVFFKNDCKYNGCGKSFSTLSSLIEHIEAVHINFDPKVSAEFEDHCAAGIPLSYVLKYSHCRQVKETTKADVRIRLIQRATKSSLEKQNIGLAYSTINDDDLFSESESSNDSWTPTKEIVLPERKNRTSPWLLDKDKPFACSVPGCKKRYKNINGIKYHYKNGHKMFEKPKKIIKHISSKRNKGHSMKITTKKIFQDKPSGIHVQCTLKGRGASSSKLSPISTDYPGFKWTDGNEECRLVISEQEGDMQKFIPLHTNNNIEFSPVDCASAYVNACTSWPVVASVSSNDLTIRPNVENNSVANTFVAYFNGCSGSQNTCS